MVPELTERVRKGDTVRLRRNAVWALTRIDTAKARAGLHVATKDADPGVRQAAAHGLGLLRDAEALGTLRALLAKDTTLAVRRVAAAGLGRLRKADAVPDLLTVLREKRIVEYAK